ncbi:MAG: TonB-dependent receptor family protein [Phaeodactylibacter sp.]|nr:TonB-dependent receptor family protein [Phaeodactylibacter sp.]MCB9301735.1 TonB-dependent receptor [Lewinellaceae bacterium]
MYLNIRRLLLGATIIFLTSLQPIQAQSQIAGAIKTENGQPLSFANVLLLSASDSSLIKGQVSGEDGGYLIKNVAAGDYLLKASMVGFLEYCSQPFQLKNQEGQMDLGSITLEEDVKELKAVEVVGKKPLFEQKIDRMVVNVEGSITAAGATALEVLERSPGVVVNRQNNSLSLAGKDGVVVMMNGKINRMPIAAVVQLLQGMPSSNIEKIELITTPPANFDAEGNAGYINIVLKQSNDKGLNGSYTLSGGYGRGSTASGGGNFNYRNNNINLFGDYSFSRLAQEQVFTFERQVLLNGETIGTKTISERDPIQRNHNARIGLDWNLSPKTVVGVLLSGYDNRWSMDALNRSTISRNGLPDTLLTIANDEVNHWKHFGGNLNFQHTIREGETLTLNADYLNYDNTNPTNYLITYNDGEDNFLFDEQTFSGKSTPIKVGVGALDYTKKFSEKIKMEAGLKGTISRFDNDVTVSRIENGVPENDPNLTAKYKLEESIGAAYTAFDLKLDDKSDLKLGLRYEYTNSNLGTEEQANIVDRQYGNFFPSAFLTRTFNDQNSANISYSRRITRPTFNDMAPFVIFVDPYTFFSGNAALQPSISNNVKVDYRFKTALFSVQYTVEDSAIARFQTRIIEGTNQQLIASENMKNRKTAAFTIAFPIKVTNWWRMQNNLIGSWQQVNAYLDGAPLQISTKNLRATWINMFTLPHDFSAELVGFYQTKGLFGTAEFLPIGALNFGIQKKFRGNAGTLRFGIDDILNSIKWRGESNFPEYNLVSKFEADFSQRTFKLTYSRNFGNKELKGSRQRQTGSEEERGRVN